MRKKLLYLLTIATLLGALCFCAQAGVHSPGTHYDERPGYPDDPRVKIVDGVAYEPQLVWDNETRTYTDIREYHVIDFFATNKLAKTATEINIVPEIDGVPVTQIVARYNPDTRCDTVKSISIPDSVTHIEQLFLFSSLETVKLPKELKTLGERCFARMESLREIRLSKGLTGIPRKCFKACKNLETVTFPGYLVKAIGADAFYGCTKLTNITIPYSVGSIGSGAFAKSGIPGVSLNTYCTLGGGSANADDTPVFYACKNLTEVFYVSDGIYIVRLVTKDGIRNHKVWLHRE